MQPEKNSTTLLLGDELHEPADLPAKSWRSRLKRTISDWAKLSGPFSKPDASAPAPLQEPTASFREFQAMLSSARLRTVLRERLEQRRGTESFQFLLVCRSIEESRNALERYQLLLHLVDKFVRDDAQRVVSLSGSSRKEILRVWAVWAHQGRVPLGVPLSALNRCRKEVTRHIVATRQEPFGRSANAPDALHPLPDDMNAP